MNRRSFLAAVAALPFGTLLAAANMPARPIRFSFVGSSITWGQGYLGEESYVGGVERYIRTQLAETIDEFGVEGPYQLVRGPNHYGGKLHCLSGVGTSVSFGLTGDTLSLLVARERGNAGAALVDVIVDGALRHTFSTFNDAPYQAGKTAEFTGDGKSRMFDLGDAFTFAHEVTVDGLAIRGRMNAGGTGAKFDKAADYLVVRKFDSRLSHALFFKTPPPPGSRIYCTYSAGESIAYMKGTLGNVGAGFRSALESAYADSPSELIPLPPVSSGIGFRETDPRAVVSLDLGETKLRSITLRIRARDPRATGPVPELFLNFATNRMHCIQNAGIGGWSARELLEDAGPNGIAEIRKFDPDLCLIEFCTNDDRFGCASLVCQPVEIPGSHVDKAWIARPGLSADELRRAESANYFRSVVGNGAGYDVEDIRIPIVSISPTAAVLSPSAAFEIEKGDVLIIGDFKGDNRRLACRIVESWDPGPRRVRWNQPISVDHLAHIRELSDLVGGYLCVKASPRWRDATVKIIEDLRAFNPDIRLLLATSGIPNQNDRRLEGYREMARQIAADMSCSFVDFYGATLNWTYSQKATASLYIAPRMGQTASGAASYELFLPNGRRPSPRRGPNWLLRGFSVKVDGEERLNRGCHILGGRKAGWANDTVELSKLNARFDYSRYRLVFTEDVPAAGARIEVAHAPVKWSDDDCHPSPIGRQLFAEAAIKVLSEPIERIAWP